MTDVLLPGVVLRGHGWRATGRVVVTGRRPVDVAVRLLDRQTPVDGSGQARSTAFARVELDVVTVDLPGWKGSWRPGESVPSPVDVTVTPGRVRGRGTRRQDAHVVAGAIDLATLTPPAAVDGLAALVGLSDVDDAVVLGPDGVRVRGSRQLPWHGHGDPAVRGPFLVRDEGGRLAVDLQVARLTRMEEVGWRTSWRRLAGQLDSSVGAARALEWSELRVTNVDDVPDVGFEVWEDGDERRERLVLPPGSLTIALTDTARGATGRAQRTVMTLTPSSVAFVRDGGTTVIEVAAGPDGTRATPTQDIRLEATRDEDGAWQESATLTGRFAPDPVQLAATVRVHGATGDDVAVFSVLEDGWLETAVPDVTEQEYVDAERRSEVDAERRSEVEPEEGTQAPQEEGTEAPPEEGTEAPGGDVRSAREQGNPITARRDDPRATDQEPDVDAATGGPLAATRARAFDLGAGAVVWGTEEVDQRASAPGDTPWSVALLDVGSYVGRWTLEHVDHRTVLAAATIGLRDVSATVDGVWWIAADGPARGGSLPETSDWTSGVRSVAVHGGSALANRRPSAVTVDITATFTPSVHQDGDVTVARAALTSATAVLGTDGIVLAALGRQLPGGRAWLRHPVLPAVSNVPLTSTGILTGEPSGQRELAPYEQVTPGGWSLHVDGSTWGRLDRTLLQPAPDWVAHDHLEQVLLSLPGATLRPVREQDGTTGFRVAYRHDLPSLDEVAASATADDLSDDPDPLSSSGGLAAVVPWSVVNERAALAALDHADAFSVAPMEVDGEYGGLTAVTDQRRDGTTMRRVTASLRSYPGTIDFRGGREDEHPTSRSGDDLLAGVDGDDGMRGGSIDLALVDGRLRDQLDHARGASTDSVASSADVVTTVVEQDGVVTYSTSLLAPIELEGADVPWQLWFRGLPMAAVDGEPDDSSAADPGLRYERSDGPATTHEWRLATHGGHGALRLGGLVVHPIALQVVEVTGAGDVASVQVDVRLRLPSGGGHDQPEVASDVRLTFSPGLSAVTPLDDGVGGAPTGGSWQLRGDAGVGALVRWAGIGLADGPALVVTGLVLDFHLFDVAWSVPVSDTLLPIGPTPANAHVSTGFTRPHGAAMWATGLSVELALTVPSSTGESDPAPHSTADVLLLHTRIELGGEDGEDGEDGGGEVTAGEDHGHDADVGVELTFDVLSEDLSGTGDALDLAWCFGRSLVPSEPSCTTGASSIQIAWEDAVVGADATVALLPGMPLDSSPRPGAVSLTFAPDATDPGLPAFTVHAAHAEVLVGARRPTDTTTDDRLHASFLGTLDDGDWRSTVQVDGVMTATSVIAYSGELADADELFPPVAEGARRLVRHRARLLLQQQELTGLVRVGSGGNTRVLFGLGDQIELALLVTHTLEALEVAGDGRESVRGRHHFTVPQTVWLRRPEDAIADLERRRADPEADLLGGFVRGSLTDDAVAAFEDLSPDTLVVSADVSAFVATSGGPPPRSSRLRALPIGVLQVARASLDDLVSTGAAGPQAWSHVTLPFLSCAGTAGDVGRVLVTDPVAATGSDDGRALRLAWALRGPHALEDPPRSIAAADGDARPAGAISELGLVHSWEQLATAPIGTGGGLAAVTTTTPDAIGRTSHPAVLSQVLDRGRRPVVDVAFDDRTAPPAPGGQALVDLSFLDDALSEGRHPAVLVLRRGSWSQTDAGLVSTPPRGAGARRAWARLRSPEGSRPLAAAVLGAVAESGAVSVVVRCTPAINEPRGNNQIVTLAHGTTQRILSLSQRRGQLQAHVLRSVGPPELRSRLTSTGPRVFTAGREVTVAYSLDADGTERMMVDGRVVAFTVSDEPDLPPMTSHRRDLDLSDVDPRKVRALLGDDIDDVDRAWSGTYHRVTVLDRAVGVEELTGATPDPDLPWLTAGLRALRAFGGVTGEIHDVHHLAAAHLPEGGERTGAIVPSPLVSFHLDESDGEGLVAAVVAELLADPDGDLGPIASRSWTGDVGPETILTWATEARRREAADARRSVVRVRRVVDAGRATSFSFLLLPPAPRTPRLGWRAQPLRATETRFTEIAYVAAPIPSSVTPVDVAAPLVDGVQALRWAGRTGSTARLAALRIATQQSTTAGVMAVGTLVWQGISLLARLRRSVRATADEPADVALPARAVLAGIASQPPLPPLSSGAGELGVSLDATSYLVTGLRPGAMMEVRAVRQRQILASDDAGPGATLVADSLPVHCRSPRPLPLSASSDPRTAMRPWASPLDTGSSVHAGKQPRDLAVTPDGGALELRVTTPAHGTVPADRSQAIEIECTPVRGDHRWTVHLHLTTGEALLDAADVNVPTTLELPWSEALTRAVGSTRPGEQLVVVARVTSGRTTRHLQLPLRVTAADRLPLVLEPRFLQFEDPEHNRRVSTAVASVEDAPVPLEDGVWDRVRVAADRGSVSAGEPLLVGVTLTRATPAEGAVVPSITPTVSLVTEDLGAARSVHVLVDGQGWTSDGADAQQTSTLFTTRVPPHVTPAHRLWVSVSLPGELATESVHRQPAHILPLTVVEPLSQPGSSAAYAVLRTEVDGAVSCPRYAVHPLATRTELVDARDILGDVVRRRAVFAWTDTVRAGRMPTYAVQKISDRGETHVPDPTAPPAVA